MIRLRMIALAVALAATVGLGLTAQDASAADKKILYYRNPMGLPDTSPVPKKDSMGMEYVPVYAEDEAPISGDKTPEFAGAVVSVDAARIQKLGVKTEPVTRRDLTRQIRAVGTVQLDEARQTVVAPRFEGWIERLAVDSTGQKVAKGDALFAFYSPQLVQIENEYLVSRGEGGKANGALEKLRALAVPTDEIDRLQREKSTNASIILRSPADGTVLEKQATEGMKFAAGDTLYRIVDLSNVWVMARLYEQDLADISEGQKVSITIAALPGQVFSGRVAFIYPDMDAETRTAKVRIELPNTEGNLRLAMFAEVKITSPTAKETLAIPLSAVIDSGDKKTVLVDLGNGRFRAQGVKTGKRTTDYVEITDGLKENDRVVTSASFLIDAESNIRAALRAFGAGEKVHAE